MITIIQDTRSCGNVTDTNSDGMPAFSSNSKGRQKCFGIFFISLSSFNEIGIMNVTIISN